MDHNVYFEGKVQSLTMETDQGRATVGVDYDLENIRSQHPRRKGWW